MKTTVKEIKRILGESSKHAVLGENEFSKAEIIFILHHTYENEDELNILETDNYFAIWR